ncbi:MAG: hypothetical protein AAF291_06750 [Pseudomonadota bacterium]
MANPNETNPLTGPFPDGDTRNITLTQRSNALEPERTGPQEPTYREDGAPQTVIGDLASSELKPGAEAPAVNDDPNWVQIGKGALGDTVNAMTPGSDNSSVMGDLLEKVGDALDLDLTGSKDDQESSTSSDSSESARAERYTLKQEPEPSPAETAFGGKGGALRDPLLQKDWNPAERNSDDLSR